MYCHHNLWNWCNYSLAESIITQGECTGIYVTFDVQNHVEWSYTGCVGEEAEVSAGAETKEWNWGVKFWGGWPGKWHGPPHSRLTEWVTCLGHIIDFILSFFAPVVFSQPFDISRLYWASVFFTWSGLTDRINISSNLFEILILLSYFTRYFFCDLLWPGQDDSLWGKCTCCIPVHKNR